MNLIVSAKPAKLYPKVYTGASMSKASQIGLGLLAVFGVAGATFAGLVLFSGKPSDRPAERATPKADQPPEPKKPPADAGLDGEAPDTTPPRLSILAPRRQAITMTPKLLLRVRSEEGAKVTVNNKSLKENSPGLFAINLHLKPGSNQLVIEARDKAGNLARDDIQATFVNISRLKGRKGRFKTLMVQLDDVLAAAAESDRQIADLLEQIDETKDTGKKNSLRQKLGAVRGTRREQKQEITKTTGEIDALLAHPK